MCLRQVKIRYLGWSEKFNEWVSLSTHRIAPFHTYTSVKKCWAKLKKWPWWPAYVSTAKCFVC